MTNSLAERFFDFDLWLVGGAHFVILFASFQVPYRLRWKQDLQQLMPFNLKLLWDLRALSGFTGQHESLWTLFISPTRTGQRERHSSWGMLS